MRIIETDPVVAARNREQAAKAHLYGDCHFAAGIVLVVLSGSGELALIPVIGLVIAAAASMVRNSNNGA